jgi:hypothetical protein
LAAFTINIAESNFRHTQLYKIRQAFGGSDFERMLDDIRRRLRAIGYPVKRNSFYSIRKLIT